MKSLAQVGVEVCSVQARRPKSIPGEAMAFQSGTKAFRCYECDVEGKFFKMYQSFRPEHAWKDEEGRTKAVLFCIDCEVKNREKEWQQWTDDEKKIAGEDYTSVEAVKKDQKNRARENWAARSDPIKGAKESLKALKETSGWEVIQVNFAQ